VVTRSAAGRTALLGLVTSRPWRIDPTDAATALELLARSNFLATWVISWDHRKLGNRY